MSAKVSSPSLQQQQPHSYHFRGGQDNDHQAIRQHRNQWDVARDLVEALKEIEKYSDVYLTCGIENAQQQQTQQQIPANRFVLAARSPVFQRMLYGSFREAKSSTICMLGYSPAVVQAVVQYCGTNAIDQFAQEHVFLVLPPPVRQRRGNNNNNTSRPSCASSNSSSNDHANASSCCACCSCSKEESSVRLLVQLSQAADYLQLVGLRDLADGLARDMMAQLPAVACIILDQAEESSSLYQTALHVIECRPYLALDSNDRIGGIECLGSTRLVQVLRNPYMEAGESFLFQMLNRWYQFHSKQQQCEFSNRHKVTDALQVATHCCKEYMQLANIEPAELLGNVKACKFVPADCIFHAIATQALRASQDRIWTLQCRGGACVGTAGGGNGSGRRKSRQPPQPASPSSLSSSAAAVSCDSAAASKKHVITVDRVLVEGAGKRDANGIYYRIAGLASGDLFSKREVACGQQYVYTLSCSLRKAPPPQAHHVIDTDPSTTTTTTKVSPDDEPFYECRIFCSKLLTHKAVRTLQTMQQTGMMDPTFQPLMQILSVECPTSRDATFSWPPYDNTQCTKTMPDPLCKYYHVCVSDGDWYMPGTLSSSVMSLAKEACTATGCCGGSETPVSVNSLVKILDFGLYELHGGTPCIHIHRISIVSTNPGHVFGKPRAIHAMGSTLTAAAAATSTNDAATAALSTSGSSSSSSSQLSLTAGEYFYNDDDDHQDESEYDSRGMQNLYTCTYPASKPPDGHAKDTRIPRTGWKVVEPHGEGPGPTCLWIPSVTACRQAKAPTNATQSKVATEQSDPAPERTVWLNLSQKCA